MYGREWTSEELKLLFELLVDERMTQAQAGALIGRSKSSIAQKVSVLPKLGAAVKRWKAEEAAARQVAGLTRKRKSRAKLRVIEVAETPEPELGFPKNKPCIGGCGRTVTLWSRNDRRKCFRCHAAHAELSHLEGVE